MEMTISRFKYSAQVYAYIPKLMKAYLVSIRKLDSKRFSESQVVEDALAEYFPKLKARVRRFKRPAHDAPGSRRRRAA